MVENELIVSIFKKKYLRSLLSNFEYDHQIVRDLNNTKLDRKNITKSNSLINIYESIINQSIVDEEYVRNIFAYLGLFNSTHFPKNEEVKTILRLFESSNDAFLYNLFLYFAKTFPTNLSSSLFSIFLNKKMFKSSKDLILLYFYDYKYLYGICNSRDNYIKYIEKVITKNANISKEKKIYSLEQLKELTAQISCKIISFLDIVEIRVFGSYHKGTQNCYSDIDFLVITDSKNHDNNLTRDLVSKSFTDIFGFNIDITAIDVNSNFDEFERSILIESTIIRKINDIL